jgi:hypothetical protein
VGLALEFGLNLGMSWRLDSCWAAIVFIMRRRAIIIGKVALSFSG